MERENTSFPARNRTRAAATEVVGSPVRLSERGSFGLKMGTRSEGNMRRQDGLALPYDVLTYMYVCIYICIYVFVYECESMKLVRYSDANILRFLFRIYLHDGVISY